MKKADYKNGCLTDRDRQIKEDEIFQARLSLIGGAEYGV